MMTGCTGVGKSGWKVWSGVLLLLVGACGIDELFVEVRAPDKHPVIPGDNLDGGPGDDMDGGAYLPDGATRLLPDGALGDARGGDGDGDWSGDGDRSGDPKLLADGGPADGGVLVVPLPGCDIDEDSVWKQSVPFGDEGGHALTPGGTGFGIAYRLDEGCDAIEASAIASVGPFPRAREILGMDQCAAFRDLALLRDDERWLVAWVDNRAGSAELHYQHLSADMGSPSGMTRVTENAVGEHKPALAMVGDRAILAWVQGDENARSIGSLALGDEQREIVPADAGHLPEKLAIAAMGKDQAAALAWINEQGDRGIWLQPLDTNGAAVGAPKELTDLASAGSTVDLAKRTRGGDTDLGGAAVYSVIVEHINREVRFRRLNAEGKPIDSERVLVGRPNRAQDASITELGEGYAVAYRAMPDGLFVDAPEIRLLFVTREGSVERDPFGRARTYKIADATATQGRTTIRASVEGQLLISWLDFDSSSGENTLKMTRRRLDCPL